MTYYKYTNKIHAENLVNKGEILIRPLTSFRAEEKFHESIGDKREGYVEFTTNGQIFDTDDPNHNRSIRGLLENHITGARQIIMITEKFEFNTDNCIILSLSKIKDVLLQQRLGKNACVQIENFEDFYDTLTNCLIERGYKVDLYHSRSQECIYDKRDYNLNEELPEAPAFIKPKSYEWQAEVRCAWTISNFVNEEGPEKFPEIKKYCSVVEL